MDTNYYSPALDHLRLRYNIVEFDPDAICSHNLVPILTRNLLNPVKQSLSEPAIIDLLEYQILDDLKLLDKWHEKREHSTLWLTQDIDYLSGIVRPALKLVKYLIKRNLDDARSLFSSLLRVHNSTLGWADTVLESNSILQQNALGAIYFFLDQRFIFEHDIKAFSFDDYIARGLEYYSLQDAGVFELLQEIASSQLSDVGIHCAIHTSASELSMHDELTHFSMAGIQPRFSRYHYLRFNQWKSTADLSSCSIERDFSFGAKPPLIGNILKSNLPVFLPNEANSLSQISTVSTLAMDGAIYSKRAGTSYQELLQFILQNKGEYSLLIHNNVFAERARSYDDLLYFIESCRKIGIVIARPKHEAH